MNKIEDAAEVRGLIIARTKNKERKTQPRKSLEYDEIYPNKDNNTKDNLDYFLANEEGGKGAEEAFNDDYTEYGNHFLGCGFLLFFWFFSSLQ